MYRNIIKPVLDFLTALIAFIVLSPIFVVVMVGLWFANNGKPFFYQLRPGKGERIFRIIKFKTMNDRCDANGQLLPDAERLTRPLLPQYLPLYNETQKRRHEVKPGITGWAQVNGRNAISWEKKFELDVWYVDHQSFVLDLKILFLTVKKVFIREGISQEGQATMEEFRGGRNTTSSL